MSRIEGQNKFDWGSFILGILMVFLALYSFQTPVSNLTAIVLVFSLSAITKGILQFFGYSTLKNFTFYRSKKLIFLGIFNILVGFFLMFNMSSSIVALPFAFSVWFIVESIGELFLAKFYRSISKGYFWLAIISGIIGIIIGIFLLSEPVVAALTLSWLVGLYFLNFGIFYIVRSF